MNPVILALLLSAVAGARAIFGHGHAERPRASLFAVRRASMYNMRRNARSECASHTIRPAREGRHEARQGGRQDCPRM